MSLYRRFKRVEKKFRKQGITLIKTFNKLTDVDEKKMNSSLDFLEAALESKVPVFISGDTIEISI